jgi:hypothetical protein
MLVYELHKEHFSFYKIIFRIPILGMGFITNVLSHENKDTSQDIPLAEPLYTNIGFTPVKYAEYKTTPC